MGRSRSRSPPRGGDVVWYRYTSPEGHPYYHNTLTSQTVWEMPTGLGVRILDPNPQPAAEMITWMRCADSLGRQYYHNPKTMQTVWERPTGPNDRIEDHPALAQAQMQMSMFGAQPFPGMYGVAGAVPGMAIAGAVGDVETFIQVNNLDASAGSKLRGLPEHIRRAVMERGNLQDARNPNAVLMGRIKEAEANAGGGGGAPMGGHQGPPPGSTPSTDVNVFIMENNIDTSAGEKLKALSPEIQKAVMERGNLTDARNPNAMLMGRIRDAMNSSR
eukprot:TRINITY_DN38015_c0_g1_i1.p2 TRINITY_DN38015_c0_g1~~TRINITY_DN38015_c0_g1_i1.p2  ORF type:complete len:274 (-),score=45.55 TRINITY_DN38015_c0_g1_i1:199-1020(-)